MRLGMFSRSRDSSWLNVFQPSKSQVGDNKASIATSLFLKTFSGRTKNPRESKSPISVLSTSADLFLKVKKGAFGALREGLPAVSRCQCLSFGFCVFAGKTQSLAEKP